MKRLIFILLLMPFAARAADDRVVAEIMQRFNASVQKAQPFCQSLPEKINQVKLMSGIAVGGNALGAIGGGTATATGFMKHANDSKIKEMSDPRAMLAEFQALTPKLASASREELERHAELMAYFQAEEKAVADLTGRDEAAKKSQMLGNIRTGGSFVAGAGAGVGAATSFIGLGTLDELIENMNACDAHVREIEKQATELRFAAPDDSNIAKMDKMVKNCLGMSSQNIADVKGKLKAGGIVSAVGAAAGVAGGITSAVANKKEAGHASNMAANVLAAGATGASLGGAVLSGMALAGLIKNGEIAEACAGAF